MPIYEYECRSCHTRIEELQKMSDPPLETCRECGGALRRLISAPAVQFKGEGWYVTDYAGKGKKDGKKESDGKSEGSESKAGGEASSSSSGAGKGSGESGKSGSGSSKGTGGKSTSKSEAKSA